MNTTQVNITNNCNSAHPKLQHLAFLTGLGPGIQLSKLIAELKNNFEGIQAYSKLPKRRTGYTFVSFEQKSQLEAFLAAREYLFEGRKLSMKPYLVGEELEKFKEQLNRRRLFVNLIPESWEDKDLTNFFAQRGEIESAYIIKDRKTGISRGFGYVITKELSLADELTNENEFDLPTGSRIVAWKHKAKKSRTATRKMVEPKIEDFIILRSKTRSKEGSIGTSKTNSVNSPKNQKSSDSRKETQKKNKSVKLEFSFVQKHNAYSKTPTMASYHSMDETRRGHFMRLNHRISNLRFNQAPRKTFGWTQRNYVQGNLRQSYRPPFHSCAYRL